MKNLLLKESLFLVELLRTIGRSEELNHDLAQSLGMSDEEFDDLADSIFLKLSDKN